MKIKLNFKRTLNTIKEFCIKHKSEIKLAVGLTAMTGAAGYSAYSTYKHSDEFKEIGNRTESLAISHKNGYCTDQTYRSESFKIVASAVKTGLKTYALPAIVYSAGGYLVLDSHRDVKTALVNVSTTCAAIASSFQKYRENVKETYGDEADYNLIAGKKEETVEEIITDKKGKEKVVKKKVSTLYPDNVYTVLFDESSKYYEPTEPGYNVAFLASLENDIRNKLYKRYKANGNTRGIITGAEILSLLGKSVDTSSTHSLLFADMYCSYDGSDNNFSFGIFETDAIDKLETVDEKIALRSFLAGEEKTVMLRIPFEGSLTTLRYAKTEL